MYQIKLKDSEKLINAYLETDKYMEKVAALMKNYLAAPAWDYFYYGKKKVRLKVATDSPTYRFLDKYSKEDNLRRLLAGDFGVQLEIIKDVYQGMPDEGHAPMIMKKHFEPIIHRESDRPTDGSETDDFNSILSHIFEDMVYDGSQKGVVHINKYDFVNALGLKVCPYCGRQYIHSVKPKRGDKVIKVKPQIDHFLPKSVFPFLALNFYNMIPCCTQCNMAPAKKEQNPIVEIPKAGLRVMQPYLFEDKAITFRYDPKSEAPLDASEIAVGVDYHGNDVYKKGYNDLFFIDALYAEHNIEAHDLYMKMKTWKSKAEKGYLSLGLTEDYLEMLPMMFFGYGLSDDQAPLRPLFKFNRDVYTQMCKDFETGRIR